MSLHDELFGSNLEGVEPAKEAGDTVPRGKYHMKIDKAEGRQEEDGSRLRLNMQLRIIGGASHVGKVLFVDLPLTESNLGKKPRTVADIKANLARLQRELGLGQATPQAPTKDAVTAYGSQLTEKEFVATVTEMEASSYVDAKTGEEKMGKARNYVIWGSVRHPLAKDENGKTSIERAQEEWTPKPRPATSTVTASFGSKL